MPPKKKDDAKKEAAEPDDGAERELVEKELVISYLKSKLGRYQEHGDQLQIDNIKLAEDLETQKLNLRDINEFLTNELKARSLTTTALEAKVFELTQAMEELKRSNETALNKLRAEKDKELDALRNSLLDYEKKGKAMQDFLDRKETMENELGAVKAELAAKIKDYEYRLTDMDRSHIQDREKWKRETMQKIKETKIQMMKLTDNQLEMTTKRTIMENEQMSIELHYQSRQTEKLMNKNMVLLEENQDLRQQLALSKQTQEELARRNNVYQKTIKSLLGKLKEQGDQQEASAPFIKGLEERIGDLELALHLAKLQSQEQVQQVETMQQRLAGARAVNEAQQQAQDTTVRFLTQCLEDVRSKIVTLVREEGGVEAEGSAAAAAELGLGDNVTVVTGRLEELSVEQRERVLAYLLEKMHVHMHQQALAAAAAEHQQQHHAHGHHGHHQGSMPTSHSARFGRRSSSRHSPDPRQSSEMGSTVGPRITGGAFVQSPSLLRSSVSAAQAAAGTGAAEAGPSGTEAAEQPSTSPTSGGGARGAGHTGVALGPGKAGMLLASHHGLQAEQAPLPIPAVDDLLSKVMADVRPWGKKAADSPLVSGPPGHGGGAQRGGGGGVFVKKPKAGSPR